MVERSAGYVRAGETPAERANRSGLASGTSHPERSRSHDRNWSHDHGALTAKRLPLTFLGAKPKNTERAQRIGRLVPGLQSV